MVTYRLSGVRMYLSPGTVRRAGIARAPCPAPCAVLRFPNGEITEAHILTDPLIFDHSDYNVSSHSVSTAGATGDVQYSQVRKRSCECDSSCYDTLEHGSMSLLLMVSRSIPV